MENELRRSQGRSSEIFRSFSLICQSRSIRYKAGGSAVILQWTKEVVWGVEPFIDFRHSVCNKYKELLMTRKAFNVVLRARSDIISTSNNSFYFKQKNEWSLYNPRICWITLQNTREHRHRICSDIQYQTLHHLYTKLIWHSLALGSYSRKRIMAWMDRTLSTSIISVAHDRYSMAY